MKNGITFFITPFVPGKVLYILHACPCRYQRPCVTNRRRPLASLPPEPTETGILLPPSRDLPAEQKFIQTSVQKWLDTEWIEQGVHEQIGRVCAEVYGRLRVNGVDELSGILLSLGKELETWQGWKESFVGPWDVANRVSELLVERMGREGIGGVRRNNEGSKLGNIGIRDEEIGVEEKETGDIKWPPPEEDEMGKDSMSIASWSNLEKHRFLQRVLEGTASDKRINYVIATSLGFELIDPEDGTWSGRSVTDKYWKQFGDRPPKFLTGASDEISEPLLYLEKMLKEGDDDGKRGKFLSDMVETYHGYEITKIERDKGNPDFMKREICVKWLHHFVFF